MIIDLYIFIKNDLKLPFLLKIFRKWHDGDKDKLPSCMCVHMGDYDERKELENGWGNVFLIENCIFWGILELRNYFCLV